MEFKKVYKGVPPFMEYKNGHGYYGVLQEEINTGKLQCHICGSLANNLAKHLYHRHKDITPKIYRGKTGLNLTTPLISETLRKKFKNNFLNLTKEKQKIIIERLIKNNKRLHSNSKRQRKNKASLELNNRYGTCPEQVKSQFWGIYKKLNRIPVWNELTPKLKYIIEHRFDSYENAIISWGIPREEYKEHILRGKNNAIKARMENNYFPKYTEEEVKDKYKRFFALNRRLPTWGEVSQFGLPGRIPFQRVFKCSKSELENSLRVI